MAKRVAVINDLSGFGKCSLTAAIPVLSAMGVQACPVPTALLTNQSGFNKYRCVDFTDNMDDYIEMWSENKAEFDGIFSGYVANVRQIDIIARFIDTFSKENTKVMVDPVMGDYGVMHKACDEHMCRKMRDIANKADYITPNMTELCILTGKSYSEVAKLSGDELFTKIQNMAMGLAAANNQTVIVTGVTDGGCIYNCIYDKSGSYLVKSKLFSGSFSGTGDLFASAFLGGIMNGLCIKDSVSKASKFLEKSIADTVCIENHDRNDGVEFEKNLKYLMED